MTSDSMEPNIPKGEYITGDLMAYQHSHPARWDVVAYQNPQNHNMWCHRIVGLPGELIDIHDSSVYINGSKISYPANVKKLWYAPTTPYAVSLIVFPYKIPDSSYFLLGDNTLDAEDSRFIGPISQNNIIAKIVDH